MALEFLNTYANGSKDDPKTKEWNEALRENGILKVAFQLWPSFWKPKPFFNQKVSNPLYVNYETLSNLLWAATNFTAEICEDLCEMGAIQALVEVLKRPDLNPKQIKEETPKNHVVLSVLSIQHNCLRHCHLEAKKAVREAGGIEVLKVRT